MNVLTDLLTDDTLLSMKLASLATTHVYAWLWRAGMLTVGTIPLETRI